MILSKSVKVKIYSKNINYYKKLGFTKIKNNDIIDIEIEKVSEGSHILVDVCCDICNTNKKLKYFKYIKNIKRQGYYTCSQKCGNEKRKKTNIKKYGSEFILQSDYGKEKVSNTNIKKYGFINPFMSSDIKLKIKKSCIEKYGVEYPMSNNSIKNKSIKTRIDKGIIFNIKSDEFTLYKNIVRRITSKNISILLKNWNGFDYYDNEYIKFNFNLDKNDPNYPTIDHKISLSNGYINNIDAYQIGNIENLCMTKKCINSSKNSKIESEFKLLLKK